MGITRTWLRQRALVREREADNRAALLELFRVQDRVAAEVVQAHAQVRRAAARAVTAEGGLKEATETVKTNLEGFNQTRRIGDTLVLVFRPQEVVAAVQALDQAYRDYFTAVADANRAQFRLYGGLGEPAEVVLAKVACSELPPAEPGSEATVRKLRNFAHRTCLRRTKLPIRRSVCDGARGTERPRVMNPLTLSLRRPITLMVLLVGLIASGVLAFSRMKKDIFPPLNLPVVYVCQPYGGMDPYQMEGLIANYYEYHFLYIGGIHHVESRNVQGVSLMKLYFHPGTDMAQAMAETVGYVNRARAFMPPGTVQPFIMRFDTGSVPVGYLVLSSETKTIGQIQDQALFRVRPRFAAIPGVSAPPPFGGASARSSFVPTRIGCGLAISPPKTSSRHSSPATRSAPRGRFASKAHALVPVNTMAVTPKDFGDIPVKPGVFIRDVVVRNPATGEPRLKTPPTCRLAMRS